MSLICDAWNAIFRFSLFDGIGNVFLSFRFGIEATIFNTGLQGFLSFRFGIEATILYHNVRRLDWGF